MSRSLTLAFALLALALVRPVHAQPVPAGPASATPVVARRGAVYVGIGILSSGNFARDMKDQLEQTYGGGNVKGAGSFVRLDLGFTFEVVEALRLYVVPELVWAYSSVSVTVPGFEAAPNQRGAGLLQYGGGVRWYFLEPALGPRAGAALFVQPGVRLVSGQSDFDDFAMKPDGLAKDLKLGMDLTAAAMPHLRIGLEAGYASIPVKKPYAGARGGDYGGIYAALACGGWW